MWRGGTRHTSVHFLTAQGMIGHPQGERVQILVYISLIPILLMNCYIFILLELAQLASNSSLLSANMTSLSHHIEYIHFTCPPPHFLSLWDKGSFYNPDFLGTHSTGQTASNLRWASYLSLLGAEITGVCLSHFAWPYFKLQFDF